MTNTRNNDNAAFTLHENTRAYIYASAPGTANFKTHEPR
jgi:hypothetical protein